LYTDVTAWIESLSNQIGPTVLPIAIRCMKSSGVAVLKNRPIIAQCSAFRPQSRVDINEQR